MQRRTQKIIQNIFIFLFVFAFIGQLIVSGNSQSFALFPKAQLGNSQTNPPCCLDTTKLENSSSLFPTPYSLLPTPKPHPLPTKLSQWQDKGNNGDYFTDIQKTKFGYLVWSKFPVKIYIETPTNLSTNLAETWVKGVAQTVQEWNEYLPLQIVSIPNQADIKIIRKVPPLQGNPPRARSALATYELYIQDNFLRHKFTILLSPSQSGKFLQAASRHELGHALGIWGHSSNPNDALYFSQVANPPQISPRDINTLKRIYQQSTSLGWKLG